MEPSETLNINSKIILNNNVEIPVLGLGTWQARGRSAKKAVRFALENGYRHIDTAYFYGNEREVGAAIQKSNIERENIYVTTKVWNDQQGYD
ncbi:MAG: aldo/keto reductase, partial [Candidatus Lokiarchaeota archaeon]|nr:aldo/keto reductase [Candidatus Lokiarchaeota archaeon]